MSEATHAAEYDDPSGSTRSAEESAATRDRPVSRRQILRRAIGGTLALPFLAGAYAWRIEPVWPTISRLPMSIQGLPESLAGLRIIQISDLHVGKGVPASHLGSVMDEVNRRQPDVVAVTGDLVHQGRMAQADRAGELLSTLSATHGVYALLGNHDWGLFSRRMKGGRRPADEIARRIEKAGVRVLRNEVVRIPAAERCLQIVGVEEYWSQDYSIETAFEEVDPEFPCIALSHNPDTFPELSRTAAQWTLSGHTHGGQVRIPLLGAPVLPIQNKQYAAGHYTLNGRHLYVNRGIGWIIRVRFGARPEITEFTLTSA